MRVNRGGRGRRRRGSRERVNPMESVANLVDIMLVFICGLMIAIIMFWNIDLDNLKDRQDDGYQDMGQVYQDPETGKIYVIESSDDSETDSTDTVQDGASEGGQSGGGE